MPHLIAQGIEPQQRWRRRLESDRWFVLGRASGHWVVPWDDHISRRHAEIRLHEGRLEVAKLAEATNPVFFQGRACEVFAVDPGEHFVIGSTSFGLVDEQIDVSLDVPHPVTEQAFSGRYLREVEFRDAVERIDTLAQLTEIISGAANDEELCVQLVNVLLAAIHRAAFVAVVAVDDVADGHPDVQVLHWDGRTTARTPFAPSAGLIREAVSRHESIVHLWAASPRGAASFTQTEEIDWAFCTPVPENGRPGWAIYVAGSAASDGGSAESVTDPAELRDDLKFTELAANTVGSLRRLRALERQKTALSQFIPPVVMDAVADQDPSVVLAPREAEVSVLFCDLRGFSRKSERAADDLMGLLRRVSLALGMMTRQIQQEGGVIGDFHGDAAMGFWGWPLPQPDAVPRACRTALGIRREFAAAAENENHPLADFRVGIGIATGRAVAGKIGTADQVKVTVFGPVVNLAARLESMTKILRAPILIDEQTATIVRRDMPPDAARVRRVALVRPYGLDTAVEVSELVPPLSEFADLTDEHIASYEAALDALRRLDWDDAFARLHHVPAEDRVKDFLTVFIAQHNRTPPDNWDGVIPITTK